MENLSKWWKFGVMGYEHPRGPGHEISALLQSDRVTLKPTDLAMVDGYIARSAANPPVPQRPEYTPE